MLLFAILYTYLHFRKHYEIFANGYAQQNFNIK